MLPTSLFLLAALVPGQTKDFHLDLRGDKPLPATVKLLGPNQDAVIRREAEGLRLTLPVGSKQTKGWGVATNFRLRGDFAITGTYELVNLEPPLVGKWAGVSVSIAPNGQRQKFAKI